MINELFAIVAPVFICAGLGFSWSKLNQPFDVEFVTNVVTAIGTPCLILSTLFKLQITPSTFGEQALAAALTIAGFAAVGAALLRWLQLPYHSYLPALMFPNSGNLGLPLALFAFGEPGLALAIGYFTIAAVSQFTIGVWLASGTTSFKKLLSTPILYAVALGVFVMNFQIQVPLWIYNTVHLIGDLTIPLMLMALGVSLARLKVGSLKRSVFFSILRLVFGLVIGTAVGFAMGLSPVARAVLILQSAMPVAVFNYLFASRYNREPEEVASMVLISTALAFLGSPILLAVLLQSVR